MKERIIGAVVLVIFVVLVVPIFLDGPPRQGEIVSQRVLLPGQEGQDIKTVVLERGRSEPIPVATSTERSADASNTRPEPQPVIGPVSAKVDDAPQPSSQRQTEPPKPAASTTGMWAVQLGSFSNKENAEKLAADLRKQGYAAFLSQLQTSSGRLHRVRIGPQKDRQSAAAMAARLLKAGHKGQVLPHP
ncbi:MAG: SPOR domain-containing protein [Proteobacteria bacterium]|nr:SPOR domain-containing protein [Pseudomonadota bacterium]